MSETETRDALTSDESLRRWTSECGSCDAGLPMACTCPEGDHRAVILALWRERDRLRGVVEAVQALADEWGIFSGDDDDFHEAINDSGAWRFARDLRAALAPVSSSGEAGCPDCGGSGVVQEAHDGGTHPVHCHCTAAPSSGEAESGERGNWTCPTCGKRTFRVIHSCPGIPQHPALSARARSSAPAPVPSGGREEAFVELLPPDVGHNLRHFGPETAHVTGSECHCHPEPIPHAVSSGGQADGEGEDPSTLASLIREHAEAVRVVFGKPLTARSLHRVADRVDALAARPVLSREALEERIVQHLDEVWTDDPCWQSKPDSVTWGRWTRRRARHLADVLTAGGEQA